MALEKKIIGLPIAKGTNEKISDRVLPLGELADAKNVQFLKGGEAKKRKGFWSLTNDIPAIVASDAARTVDTGKAVASYNDEILAFDGRYGYTKTSTDDDWVNKGTVVGCTLENELVEAGTNLVQTPAQIGQANNFEVHVWSEVDPTETVNITNSVASCATAGGNLATIDFVNDHNLSPGGKVTIDFSATWDDGTYIIQSVTDENSLVIDYTKSAPGSTTTGTTSVTLGVVWRTYAKVIDKTTKSEIVAKTLINVFSTNNSMYNIPRAQVAVGGQYVFILVHVGSGRIKYTKVDTGAGTGAIAAALSPGLLTNSASDVLFNVDLTNPDWCVEAVNNATISNGLVVFKRHTDSTQRLRLSYYTTTSGTLAESSVAGSPISITTEPHFPPALLVAPAVYTTEAYPGSSAKQNLELVGGLMLKVVTPSDSLTGDYVAIGYTSSVNGATGGRSGGSSDEPGGIKLQVYNADLVLQGAEQTVNINSEATDYDSTGDPGYILINGTAGKNESGKVRFFLTMIANKTNFYARSPEFLVNAYDYTLAGGITDKSLNLYGITVTSDCFAYGRDLYLGVGHATRPNQVAGDGRIAHSIFNTSVGMIMNHQGQVVAKTAIGAGPWTQEIDFRFCQYNGFNRVHCMYGVPRVVAEGSSEVLTGSINPAASTTVLGDLTKFTTELAIGDLITVSGETRQVTAIASDTSLTVGTAFSDTANDTSPEKYVPGKFRYGSSRYSGVNVNSDGLDLTAMDAAVGTMDFAPVRYLPSVQANGALKVAGGILWDYSGDYFKEDNFFYYPEIHSVDVSSGTGLSGTFSYKAIFEWVDHNGKIQRSNPSSAFTTGVISNKAVTLRLYNLHLTHKRDASTLLNPGGYAQVTWGARSEVKIVLYRTKTVGSVYHRCAEVLMDYSDRFQTITDTLADTDLLDNPVLYTTGGIAGHICPPSQYDIALWKDRVFLATTENTVWFSKRFAENRETGFSDSFVRSVDNRSEKIRALCPNLEHLLIFGERNGYYMSGDGPSDSGAGPGFSPLRVFAPGQGALDGTCRVETPAGVFFQTRQGLMLCARNMQVTPKGAKVEDQITATNHAIDGHVFQKEHEVRFVVSGGQTIAVYNYLFDQWTTWHLDVATGTNAGSVVVDGDYYRLNTVGVLYKQQTTTYYDKVVSAVKPYQFLLGTGWINVGQLQQLGRVYQVLFLGDYNAAANPRLLIYTDYSTSATTVSMSSPPGTSKFQLAAKLPKQKVKALKFQIAEDTPGAGGDVMSIQSFALLVGLKKPGTSFKLPAANQISGG